MTQMRKATDSYDSAALEEVAARTMIKRSSAAVTVLRPETARNDDTLEEPASSREELDAWARHTFAANGFGDAPLTGGEPSQPNSSDLYLAARARRSFGLGEILVAMIGAVVGAARQAHARYRQFRVAADTYDTLRRLDDHELKDLGFDRSEIASVAAEAAGAAAHTRTRASRTTHRVTTATVREPA